MFNNMIEASWVGGLDYHVIRNLEARLENLIIIQQESDFPNQDETTIYGEEGHAYLVVKPFITGKQFIGTNTVIRGINNITPFWTYTGTGYAIQNTLNSRVSFYDIGIYAPNGIVMKINGSNTGNVNERMNISDVILSGRGIAEIDGAAVLVLGVATISGDGTVQDLININSSNMLVVNLDRVLATGIPSGGSIINFNNTISQEYEISNLIYSGASDGHVFKGLPNSGNVAVGGSFSCEGGNFLGSNNPLVGMTVNDVRHFFYDNNGLDPTQIGGNVYLDENTTGIIIINTTGVYEQISSGTFLTTIAGKFEGTQRCGLKNISDIDIFATISFIGILNTGGTTDIGVKLYLDDGITETEVLGSHQDWLNQQARPMSTSGYVKIPAGSEVFPKFENNSNTTNFSIPNCQLIVAATG